MTPIQLFDPASSTFTYVLFDTITREALIIDPVDEQIERDLAELRARGLKLVWTVETHAHADHITSAGSARGTCRRADGGPRRLRHHLQRPCSCSTVTRSRSAASASRHCTHPVTPREA
jgi:glyoxylase-like metal-dependent hydrolase (beta-lactamase superfamily II)